MDSDPTIHVTSNYSRRVFVAGLAWFLAYLAARYVFETMPPRRHWDIVVANIPVIAFFWFVWVVRRALKEIDELRRRIHLEALALAFPTTMLVLMTLGLLDSPASPLGLPLRDIWVLLPLLYGMCFAVVNQKYR